MENGFALSHSTGAEKEVGLCCSLSMLHFYLPIVNPIPLDPQCHCRACFSETWYQLVISSLQWNSLYMCSEWSQNEVSWGKALPEKSLSYTVWSRAYLISAFLCEDNTSPCFIRLSKGALSEELGSLATEKVTTSLESPNHGYRLCSRG